MDWVNNVSHAHTRDLAILITGGTVRRKQDRFSHHVVFIMMKRIEGLAGNLCFCGYS